MLQIAWPTLLHPVQVRSTLEELRIVRDVLVDESYSSPLGSNPAVIFDVGANIGLASVWFASRFPNSLIVALEPESRQLYTLLEANSSPYGNIQPVAAPFGVRRDSSGLGIRPATLTVFRSLTNVPIPVLASR